MKTHYIIIFIISLIMACRTEKKSQPTDEKSIVIDTLVSKKSTGKTTDSTDYEKEEYDEMKFMPPIESDSYFGIVAGAQINDHQTLLKPGDLRTGEGQFDVHYMVYNLDTLGYVFGDNVIESIHIWDSRGATNNGIRVGTTFGELKDHLTEPNVHGSEVEARVHVFNENHMYLLDYYSMEYDLDHLEIPDTVVVKEIIITK